MKNQHRILFLAAALALLAGFVGLRLGNRALAERIAAGSVPAAERSP